MPEKRRPTTPLRDITRESLVEPPPRSDVDALPPMGDGAVAMDLSGLALVIEGLGRDLAGLMKTRFGPYACRPGDAPSPLRIRAHLDRRDYYVEPDLGETPEGYYRLRIVHDGGLIRMVAYSMAAWLDLAKASGGVAFGQGEFDPRERALENLCRVAVAWMAVRRGGFFIHGASIVRGGRAYVFFGKSASGKSTLCSLSSGGQVVSDDLTLVLPGPSGAVVVGSPFRGTYGGGEPVLGTYPLAGMFQLVQGERTHVDALAPLMAFAEYFANLPFVNDALHAYPDLMARLEEAIAGIPVQSLHFTTRDDFWPAVEASLR